MSLLQRVDNSNLVEITDIDSLRASRGKLLEKIGDAKRNPMGLAQKIDWLQEVNAETDRIMAACERLGKDFEEQIHDLPVYDFSALMERIGASCNCGLLGGPIAKSLVTVNAVRVEVAAQLSELGQRELKELDLLNTNNDPQTMPILHLYDLIGKLQPSERHYLRGLAKRLMIERAYSKALELLEHCPEYPNLETQRLKISALKGAGRYVEAINTIAECKLSLKDSHETPELIGIRVQIEDMKADCLVGMKDYRQAREVLEALVNCFPASNLLKRKMVFVTIFDEVQQFINRELKNKQYFLQRAKMQFNQLEEYLPNIWSQRGLESDFDFWLFVLTSNAIASESSDIAAHAMKAIGDLIDSGLVSIPAIEKGLKGIATRLEEEVTVFAKQFKCFMEETSSKTIPFRQDIQEAVQNARLGSMETQIYGDKVTGSNAGILHKIAIIEELVKNLNDLPDFQKSEQKTLLCTITLSVQSAKKELGICSQGLALICKEGFHPLADKLQLAIMPKNNGALALEDKKEGV